MKPAELIAALKVALTNKEPVLITGRPGIGKTDIVNKTAKELGYDIMTELAVTSEPIDFKGLPALLDGKAVFSPYGNLDRMINATKPLVVFFDDIGWASTAVQSALCGLILKREVNGVPISEEVRFVAATNRRQDGAGVSTVLTPLLSRFSLITPLEVSLEDWKRWGIANNMPTELLAFCNWRPALFEGKIPKVENGVMTYTDAPISKEIENFACPRTIAALGRWLNAGVTSIDVWKGVVGLAFATEFMAFYQTYRALAGLPDKVINDPDNAPIPDKTRPDIIFALIGALSSKASEVNLENILKYIIRLDMAEMMVFFIKDAITRHPNIQETDAWIQWTIKYGDIIQ